MSVVGRFAPSVRAAAFRSSGIEATEPAMIKVMKGTAFQAIAMITPNPHSSRTSFGSESPIGVSMRESIPPRSKRIMTMNAATIPGTTSGNL